MRSGAVRLLVAQHQMPHPFQGGSLLPRFGVRVSVTFYPLFVHIISSSVWVAEWSPFGKELPTSLTICSFVFLLFVISITFRFGFEGGIWVLIVLVPVHRIYLLL